jgi:hypothetical protein
MALEGGMYLDLSRWGFELVTDEDELLPTQLDFHHLW